MHACEEQKIGSRKNIDKPGEALVGKESYVLQRYRGSCYFPLALVEMMAAWRVCVVLLLPSVRVK